MKPGEIKAKNVLEKVYPDKYKNLLICDKPDLQDEFNCIGVEVTYGILSENNEKGVYEKYNKEINNAREEDIKLITNCLDELLLECCDKPETKKKFFQSLKSYLPENKIEKIYNEIVETNKIEMDNDFFRDKKLPNKVIHKLNIDNCLDDNDKQRLLSVTKSIISIRKQGYTTIHSGYVGKVFRVKDSFLLDPFCDKLDKLNKIESNHNLGYKIF
ncbi:MAG: hypothetical protein RBQ94_05615 [Methanimicrococcus sp.]|nr:hypothetical protein [Methanimicrococcus sp.]